MKKIMILAAALGLLVACGGNAEKKSIEAQAKEYMEKAVNAKTVEEYKAAMNALEDWGGTLSEEELTKAKEVTRSYKDKLEKKVEELYDGSVKVEMN